MITSEHEGKILVLRGVLRDKTLEQAIKNKIAGIVVGSMHYFDLKSMAKDSDIGISILITEGCGEHPINEETYNLLCKQDHYYAIINPQEHELLSAVESNKEIDIPQYQDKARIVWGDQQGIIGKISARHNATLFPSGITSASVEIQAGSQTYLVPLANVEMLH